MDDHQFREIIERLPEKRSRSRLEPYRQLIAELRRLRRTYREIAHILVEECQVQVSAAAVHNFVRLHLRRTQIQRRGPGVTAINERPIRPAIRQSVATSAVSDEEVRRRIAELKHRPIPAETPALFHYDPNEPLHLLPKSKEE
jgi:hypothetical protein